MLTVPTNASSMEVPKTLPFKPVYALLAVANMHSMGRLFEAPLPPTDDVNPKPKSLESSNV